MKDSFLIKRAAELGKDAIFYPQAKEAGQKWVRLAMGKADKPAAVRAAYNSGIVTAAFAVQKWRG